MKCDNSVNDWLWAGWPQFHRDIVSPFAVIKIRISIEGGLSGSL
jgi:hypothetical protein